MSFANSGWTVVVEDVSEIPAFVYEKPYVLVVDDEPSILSVILMVLEAEGYNGIGFSNSQKVIPFFEHIVTADKQKGLHLPSVMMLDLMMPVVSGYKIAAQLSQKEETAKVPIIVLTADYRVSSASAVPGASDFLSKPFRITTLLAKVEKYCALASAPSTVSEKICYPL